jgi:predicted PurR-regulated permease PerM
VWLWVAFVLGLAICILWSFVQPLLWASVAPASRSLRASVNGTVVVGLFDGILIGIIGAIAGVAHPEVWGAQTGLLAIVPFLGYVAAVGLALTILGSGSAITASTVLGVACLILFIGDKIVRPLLVGNATELRFVWVLLGSLGGIELLGLPGLFIGPVVLTLAGALWRERAEGIRRESPTPSNPSRSVSQA